MVVANDSVAIDDIVRGPEPVPERVPDDPIAVDGDRIRQAEALGRLVDIARVSLERKFWRMDTDNDKAVVLVLLCPRLHEGNSAQAVDTGVRPKIDEDDLAA